MLDITQQFGKYLRAVNTPTSLKVQTLIDYEEWDQIADLSVDPANYLEADDYFVDAVAVSFLRKLQDLPCSYKRKENALQNFYDAERQCCATNTYLTRFLNNGPFEGSEAGLYEFFNIVREKIRLVLGPVPRELNGSFGPGATATDPSVYATVAHKCCSDPSMTSGAQRFIPLWGATAWGRSVSQLQRAIQIRDSNVFTSVPKTAKTDRGICMEPSVNVFLQLGVGKVIRQRLKSHAGIDLQHGKELHMKLAREGSQSGHLATIDLKNASDTVCKNLVKLLLPSDWHDLLCWLRSPKTEVLGKDYFIEKFSSMGNGFTFELETLIFWAIAKSCCTSGRVYVYGDDIICPSQNAALVVKALEVCGFTVNDQKSFLVGQFRESCGGDFFNGANVRPLFLENIPHEPQEWISLANGIRRIGCTDDVWDPRFLAWWHSVLDAIPAGIRKCRGPSLLGDLCINDVASRWHTKVRDSTRFVQCYTPDEYWVWSWRRFPASAILAAALYGVRLAHGERGVKGFSPRSSVVGYATRWVAYS